MPLSLQTNQNSHKATRMSNIDVKAILFPQLFSEQWKVIIPEFQRPYVWGKDKAEELLEDFKTHFLLSGTSRGYYYMGNVLYYFNKDTKAYEIIDGQQRITTLLIMKSLINGPLPYYQDLQYNAGASRRNIKEIKRYFEKHLALLQQLHNAGFLEHLQFTLISTQSEDDAFIFFDTQNNRGVKLSATDFLKAYHLRAVKAETLQETAAKQWETASLKGNDGSFLSFLFDNILWRARNWKGQKQLFFEDKDAILDTFQKQTLKVQDDKDTYLLYPNHLNRHTIKHTWDSEITPIPTLYFPVPSTPANYPFSIRQPLYKGIHFFKYTEKYVALYEELFYNPSSDPEIQHLQSFLKQVYTEDMSKFLRHFMHLCLLMYYDSFGTIALYEAGQCFDYLLGSIRLDKQQVKREAVRICLEEHAQNLLDVIAHAYLPGEVFSFIYNLPEVDKIYENEKLNISDSGVRGRYKSRVLNYFCKDVSFLKNRKSWSNYQPV